MVRRPPGRRTLGELCEGQAMTRQAVTKHEVVEIEKPRRLVLKWRNEWKLEMREEGYSRCVVEIEQADEVVKLTVIRFPADRLDEKGDSRRFAKQLG
jgi:uncharacterized protein YndB with AHSA1/START domain